VVLNITGYPAMPLKIPQNIEILHDAQNRIYTEYCSLTDMSISNHLYPLIDFIRLLQPVGSAENQFTPLGAGVNKLIFKPFRI
jgi:hypothetical protein